jgi:hypothetical protein
MTQAARRISAVTAVVGAILTGGMTAAAAEPPDSPNNEQDYSSICIEDSPFEGDTTCSEERRTATEVTTRNGVIQKNTASGSSETTDSEGNTVSESDFQSVRVDVSRDNTTEVLVLRDRGSFEGEGLECESSSLFVYAGGDARQNESDFECTETG